MLIVLTTQFPMRYDKTVINDTSQLLSLLWRILCLKDLILGFRLQSKN